MALSTALGLCGDVTWAVLVMVRHEPPSPSLADAFYLASIVAVFPALYRQFGSPLRRSCELLDSSMVILLIAYLGFSYVLRPQLAGGVSWEAAVTECQTALMLVAGGWAVLVPLTVEVRPPLGVRLVSLAVAVQATSWLVYTYALVVRGVGDGSWIYTGWQASWALMIAGAAAIVLEIGRGSIRRHLCRPARGLRQPGWRRSSRSPC